MYQQYLFAQQQAEDGNSKFLEIHLFDLLKSSTKASILRQEALIREKQREQAILLKEYEITRKDAKQFYDWQQEMKRKGKSILSNPYPYPYLYILISISISISHL